jgi:hypothetical protein
MFAMSHGRWRAVLGSLLLALFAIPEAFAQQAFSAPMPAGLQKVLPAETFRAGGAQASIVALPAPDPGTAAALRERNTAGMEKRLQSGFGRSLAGVANASSERLRWESVGAGHAAHWEVFSPGAAALRIAIEAARLPKGAELRFAGSADPATVYGPFTVEEVLEGRPYWSPVLEGERATVEVFVPQAADIGEVSVRLRLVSHLIASPSSRTFEKDLKLSGGCEVNLICLSATDSALAETGRAVARMSFAGDDGGGYTCTGTLLATTAGPGAGYFYTAAHCIDTQAEAATLTTHWNQDYSTCGGMTPSAQYVQIPGGAILLYANDATDVSLLRLNQPPAPNAIYAGWNADPLAIGTDLTAVHHPAGDAKKVSLGSMAGYTTYGGGAGSTHIDVTWKPLVAPNGTFNAVTEGGSSGSGVFTAVGSPASSYQLRGGLHGGPSYCGATGANLRDYYSRFDNAFPFIRQYLDTSCAITLGPGSATSAVAGGPASFTVTSACAWTTVSDSSWLTTSSAGAGNGSVDYAVAPNTGAGRTGRIYVGDKVFTVTQPAGFAGTNATVNGDFEQGPVAWAQTASDGAQLIVSEPTQARAGSFDARLGGSDSATHVLYQDIAIPANATTATLRFWRRIASEESGSTIYDRLEVALVNPSGGAALATLVSLSNANAGTTWVEHTFDVTAHKGRTVRLRFTATCDGSYPTTFRIDDVSLHSVVVVNPPRMTNISTRMQVLAGNDVMIGGFVIGGSASKTVAVVATGPSLAAFGIANPLANPTLTLVRSSDQATLATNDDWGSAANADALSLAGFAPGNPLEAAILTTLPPGAYTAIVQGAGGGTGVGVVGVYEVSGPEVPLTNISTRGRVLTGNDVMIGGFVIGGSGPQTLAIVATGPSLAPFGIANPLPNPKITLVRSSDHAILFTNDDWQADPQAAQLLGAGFAPGHALEAGLHVTLQPGAYTVIVEDAGGGTGVAVIGVYKVN